MRTAYTVAVCLLAFAAMGGTITSIDPASIPYRGGEFFLTLNGTSLDDTIVFDGPAGHFELESNASGVGYVISWVPMDIVNDPGTYTVYTTGRGGDSNKKNFTVVKPGRPPLTLHLPEVITALAKSRLGNVIKYDINAIGGEGEVTVKCDPESGSTFPYGESSIRCFASDQAGGKADGVIAVKVWDGAPPTLSLPKSFEVPSDDEKGAYVKFDTSAIDEIDGGVRVVCSRESGTLFPNGRTTVNCEAGDEALNLATGSFEVFVQPKDPGRLSLKVPDKVVEVASDPEGGEVFYEVTAYGSADPDPLIQCEPPSGWFFPMKTTKVYCTAEDDFGSRAEGVFYVEVVERLGLKLPDVTAEATSPAGTEVSFEAVAEDWTNAIRCSPGSGAFFGMGESTVECQSTDGKGRAAGGTFRVNVADTIAPHIGRIRTIAGTKAGDAVPVTVEVETTDAGDAMPLCSVSALTADAGGAFDGRVKGDLELEIRDTTRPFRIQVSCVDASGNRSTGTAVANVGEKRPRSQILN
jgi:large repetitive protein